MGDTNPIDDFRVTPVFEENPVVAAKRGTSHLRVNINAASGLPRCHRTTECPRTGRRRQQAAREPGNAGASDRGDCKKRETITKKP